jgi:hypothetical protein
MFSLSNKTPQATYGGDDMGGICGPGDAWGFLASGIERALPSLSWETPYQPRAIFVLTVNLISVLRKLGLEKLCPFQ